MSQAAKAKTQNWPRRFVIGFAVLVLACIVYVRTHPLVFNESAFSHAHCIKLTGLGLEQYAADHGGVFPTHTNGYGDALLLLAQEGVGDSIALTGPGYDPGVFEQALSNHTDVVEADCGRVYVQGLTKNSDPELAIFFDKLPTPGGDHCHLARRLWAPLGKEVWMVGGGHKFVRESDWPEFAKKQIELLVKEGFNRSAVEALYNEKGKLH